MNADKTEDTILKRFKHTKVSKNKPSKETHNQIRIKTWRQKRFVYGKQLSTYSLNKLEEIIKRRIKLSAENRLKLCNILVRSALLYKSSTWKLFMNDEKAVDSFQIKHFHKIIGLQWRAKMRNEKNYELTQTRALTIDITKVRWKLWGHVFRLNGNTLVGKAMKYLFIKTSPLVKKFKGRKRLSLVTTLNRYIERIKK